MKYNTDNFQKMTNEFTMQNKSNTDKRNLKSFYYENKEVSWNELPLDVRKHDYPYYFDENGVDHYPMIMVE